jgi:hypothetical protein
MTTPKWKAPKIRIRQNLYDRVAKLADALEEDGVTRTSIVESAVEQFLDYVEAQRMIPKTVRTIGPRPGSDVDDTAGWYVGPSEDPHDDPVKQLVRVQVGKWRARHASNPKKAKR